MFSLFFIFIVYSVYYLLLFIVLSFDEQIKMEQLFCLEFYS